MTEPIYLTTVLFAPEEEESRCRLYLRSAEPITIAGVGPSGKRHQMKGIVKSIKANSILHPGYPLMVTLAEKFPDNGG